MSDAANELKYQRFTAMMQNYAEVYVHLDARPDTVTVPEVLKEYHDLILCFGLNLPVPINNLVVNAKGISATLSFGRVPHDVSFPWSVVYALATEGESQSWPEYAPRLEPEVVYENDKRPFDVVDGDGVKVEGKKPDLKLVKSEDLN